MVPPGSERFIALAMIDAMAGISFGVY